MQQEPFPSRDYDERVRCLAQAETIPANRAWIYYTAAHDLFQSGVGEPDLRIGYAAQALDLRLPLIPAVQAHIIIGSSIQMKYRGATGEELVGPRKEAAEAYLRAIRTVMDSDLPATRPVIPEATWSDPGNEDSVPHSGTVVQPVPTWRKPWFMDSLEPDKQGVKAAQERDALRRERVRLHELAALWDDAHIRADSARRAVVSLYTKYPPRTDELRLMAQEIVRDQAFVNALVDEVKAHN
jgi:hypothetical protein